MILNTAYIFILILLAVILASQLIKNEVVYTKSNIDDNMYLVRNLEDKTVAADMLSTLKTNMFKLVNHLKDNREKFKEEQNYIDQLVKNIKYVDVKESGEDSIYTSYSVNKGEEIFFCLRSKKMKNKFHDMNLIMYVALHELAHVATPERGHTPLFNKNFEFLASQAVEIGIYHKIDFANNPMEYCGLMITASII